MFSAIMSPHLRRTLRLIIIMQLLFAGQHRLVRAQSRVLLNTTLTIPFDKSVKRTIDSSSLADATYLRADFFANPKRSRPHILLYAADSPNFDPVVTDGFSERFRYPCNASFPCFNNYSAVDNVGLLTRRLHHYISIPLTSTNPSDISLTVRNYRRNITTADRYYLRDDEFRSEATGLLLVRAIDNQADNCPVTSDGQVCANNGKCHAQRCQCNDGFVGRVCDDPAELLNFSTQPKFQDVDDLTYKTLSFTNFSQQTFQVDLPASRPKTAALLLYLEHPSSISRPCFFFSLTETARNNTFLHGDTSSLQPSLADNSLIVPIKSAGYLISLEPKTEGAGVKKFISFLAPPYRMPSDCSVESLRYSFSLCGVKEAANCPTTTAFPIAILPLSLGAFAITVALIIILNCLDARLRFVATRDKLSESELNRMYPKTRYSQARTQPRGGPEASMDAENCHICLEEFDDNEQVRVLSCSHVYHSQCVDQWLTGNQASCPTCRANARIDDLSDSKCCATCCVCIPTCSIGGHGGRRRRAGNRESNEQQGQQDQGEDEVP